MSQRRKSIAKAKRKNPPSRKIKTSLRQKMVTAGVVILALLFAASMYFSTPGASSRRSASTAKQPLTNSNTRRRPSHNLSRKENYNFIKEKTYVKSIDIEIANTAKDIQQGLMYRQKMDEDKVCSSFFRICNTGVFG